MNMKRIVFVTAGILLMLVIIFWTLHSMAHIDEINQKRRDKNKGEAIASQMIVTTATTSIWDALRQTEPSAAAGEDGAENPDISAETQPDTALDEEQASDSGTLPENAAPLPQTITETAEIPVS